jgi:hypothetical protein
VRQHASPQVKATRYDRRNENLQLLLRRRCQATQPGYEASIRGPTPNTALPDWMYRGDAVSGDDADDPQR